MITESMDGVNKESFDEMCRILLQKDFIIKNKGILDANGILDATNGDVRKLCSSYMIKEFPNDVFGVGITEAHAICKACHLAAQELHLALVGNGVFQEKWGEYKKVFNEWIIWDLKQLRVQYQSTISLLDMIRIENPDTCELVGACDELKGKLSRQMQMLIKSDIAEVIESLSKVQISQDIEAAVTRHVHDAYWSSLYENLMSDNFSEIGKIIQLEKDILLSICRAGPDKIKIEEILDAEFICQLLTYDCYDKQQMVSLLLAIYDLIQGIGPPCDDDDIKTKKFEIVTEFQSCQDKSTHTAKCIIYFRDILERSLKIVSAISELHSTYSSTAQPGG